MDYGDWQGLSVRGDDAELIGEIEDLFDDAAGGGDAAPALASVRTGRILGQHFLVPLRGVARRETDSVTVPFERSTVESAPTVSGEDEELGDDAVERVYRHYGLEAPAPTAPDGPERPLTGRRPIRRTVRREVTITVVGLEEDPGLLAEVLPAEIGPDEVKDLVNGGEPAVVVVQETRTEEPGETAPS